MGFFYSAYNWIRGPTLQMIRFSDLQLDDLRLKSQPFMANQPTPPITGAPPQIHKGLIAGLIKGSQWVFISPNHKAGYFWGGYVGGGWLTSHETISAMPWRSYVRPSQTIRTGWFPLK